MFLRRITRDNHKAFKKAHVVRRLWSSKTDPPDFPPAAGTCPPKKKVKVCGPLRYTSRRPIPSSAVPSIPPGCVPQPFPPCRSPCVLPINPCALPRCWPPHCIRPGCVCCPYSCKSKKGDPTQDDPSGSACNQSCAGRRRICPPPSCNPGPIPYNPCCPQFHKGSYKPYKTFFFLMLPLIILGSLYNFGGVKHCKPGPCREYEYMLIRTKRFPWGDGVKSFFHNEHLNKLPGDCEPPPITCKKEKVTKC